MSTSLPEMTVDSARFSFGLFAAEKKSLKQVAQRIDQVWKKRLVSGEPFEASLNEEKVPVLLEMPISCRGCAS